MKTFIIVLILLLAAPAVAQRPLPTTLPLIDNNTKETIGTATLWGRKMVLRKTDGTFIATIAIEPDGTRKMFDENGKILDQIPPNVMVPKVD